MNDQLTKPTVEYLGSINEGESRVVVRRGDAVYDLDPRLDLRRHSPTGFSWGYSGSGPAQLSLAMLADYFGSCTVGDILAQVVYLGFKDYVIASIPQENAWTFAAKDMAATLTQLWQKNRDLYFERLRHRLEYTVTQIVSKRIDEGELDEASYEAAEAELLLEFEVMANHLMHDQFST